jgi:hypothetical protein
MSLSDWCPMLWNRMIVTYSTPEMSTKNISTLEDNTTTLSRRIRHQPLSDEGPNRKKMDTSGTLSSVIIVQYCREVPMFQRKLLSQSYSKMEISHHRRKRSSCFVNAEEQRYSSAAPKCAWCVVTSEQCLLALCYLPKFTAVSPHSNYGGNSLTYSQLLHFMIILSSGEITIF